jgi:hypothetical protein
MAKSLPSSSENNEHTEYGAGPGAPVRRPDDTSVDMSAADAARIVRQAGHEPEFIPDGGLSDKKIPGTTGAGGVTKVAQELADYHTQVAQYRRRRLAEHTNGYAEEVERLADQ